MFNDHNTEEVLGHTYISVRVTAFLDKESKKRSTHTNCIWDVLKLINIALFVRETGCTVPCNKGVPITSNTTATSTLPVRITDPTVHCRVHGPKSRAVVADGIIPTSDRQEQPKDQRIRGSEDQRISRVFSAADREDERMRG